MRFLAGILGVTTIGLILIDAFESVLLPRRVTHAYRLIRLFYRITWPAWKAVATLFTLPRRREAFLSTFAPLSFLMMFAAWAIGMILGFALLHWAFQTQMATADPERTTVSYTYFSGVTFFTVGYGDISPQDGVGRFLAVLEAGLGFGFLALVLSYHPILAQAFSQRETMISLLDARGGSPPQPSRFWCGASRLGAPTCSLRTFCSGKSGRPRCSKSASPFQCWVFIARSTITSRGWPR